MVLHQTFGDILTPLYRKKLYDILGDNLLRKSYIHTVQELKIHLL